MHPGGPVYEYAYFRMVSERPKNIWFLEKSTLNPDLPYNLLPFKRFLLYFYSSSPFFNQIIWTGHGYG